MTLTFIDFFAGVGGFRRGMELAGHKCVGFCEVDKHAVASYTSMHLITDEQRQFLSTLPLRQRQEEILNEQYRNEEWFSSDINKVCADDIPRSDCWCFGFPCQDISLSGKQAGLSGSRSSLFFRVMYLAEHVPSERKPRILLIENVKNLLHVSGGWDFARLLIELDKGGYDAEWEVLNSKDFGVPQNRERVFIVGHLRGESGSEVFPIEGTDGSDSVEEEVNGVRYVGDAAYGNGKIHQSSMIYSADGLSPTITSSMYKSAPKIAVKVAEMYGCSSAGRVYDTEGLSPTLTALSGGNTMPMIQVHTLACDEGKTVVRRLTPRECWRLQGWTDDYFDKAAFVSSDTQLYRQAGNGVTVPVIKAIAKKLE